MKAIGLRVPAGEFPDISSTWANVSQDLIGPDEIEKARYLATKEDVLRDGIERDRAIAWAAFKSLSDAGKASLGSDGESFVIEDALCTEPEKKLIDRLLVPLFRIACETAQVDGPREIEQASKNYDKALKLGVDPDIFFCEVAQNQRLVALLHSAVGLKDGTTITVGELMTRHHDHPDIIYMDEQQPLRFGQYEFGNRERKIEDMTTNVQGGKHQFRVGDTLVRLRAYLGGLHP